MADKEGNVKGKGETSGCRASTKKEGGLIPKERKHVSQMVGQKIAVTMSSGVKNIKNKNKVIQMDTVVNR